MDKEIKFIHTVTSIRDYFHELLLIGISSFEKKDEPWELEAILKNIKV